MYDMICTQNDILRERFISGAELVGKYEFPKIDPINANLDGLKPVPFHLAGKEKNPRQAVCHCFVDDFRFETLWKDPTKSIETLLNFKYFCPCDFSVYSNMPLALQIYQIYRMRVIHYFLTCCGVKCIPVVTWSDENSFDFCFDGLPTESTLAVSTNGCFTPDGKKCYRSGFSEMCNRLKPDKVLIVGREIEVESDTDLVYMDSYGQQMSKRLGD